MKSPFNARTCTTILSIIFRCNCSVRNSGIREYDCPINVAAA